MSNITSDLEDLQLNKGMGIGKPLLSDPSHGIKGWNILDENVSLPAACVVVPALEHNIDWMANFVSSKKMELCPHVKTTMCPKLMLKQLDKGCWGLTTATVQQTVATRHFTEVQRILMANQLVGKVNMQQVSDLLANDPSCEFYCLVDSVSNVKELASFFGDKQQQIRVLVEIGIEGGRTGIRTQTALAEILQALKAVHKTLLTCGVEFFEGIVKTESEVRAFCKKACDALLFLSLVFPEGKELIISGAGSAWFDIVAGELYSFRSKYFDGRNAFDERKLVPVLRSGCYVVHDVGLYKEMEKRVRKLCTTRIPPFKPALKIVAYVQSRPEPTLAIIGMGRRDVATDVDFPKPFQFSEIRQRRWVVCPESWKITNVMDQHAFLTISQHDKLATGDIVSFDIVHPCNTFSAWRQVLLVDESYNVLDIAPTYF